MALRKTSRTNHPTILQRHPLRLLGGGNSLLESRRESPAVHLLPNLHHPSPGHPPQPIPQPIPHLLHLNQSVVGSVDQHTSPTPNERLPWLKGRRHPPGTSPDPPRLSPPLILFMMLSCRMSRLTSSPLTMMLINGSKYVDSFILISVVYLSHIKGLFIVW